MSIASMSFSQKLKLVFKEPYRIILWPANRGLLRFLPRKTYLGLYYKAKTGKKIDWNNLKGFNEKLQWLSLYDRKSEYTDLVDKYEVKKIVGKIIGEQYIIPTLGAWEHFNDIDIDSLPNRFVLKCNHNAGCIAFCTDKKYFNIEQYREKFNKALKTNRWYVYQEWPYKNVKRKIIAEPLMENYEDQIPGLIDYKFFCFNGEPKFMYIAREPYRQNHESCRELNFFDMDFKLLPVVRPDSRNFDIIPSKPKGFEVMKKLAKKLSKSFKFIRVDLYEINGQVYFGELTFKPTGGFMQLEPEEYDIIWGEYLQI